MLFLAPDYAPPSGGLRTMYRHVDILNAAGIAAAAVHQRPGFRYSWFENSTATAPVDSVELGPQDVLVFGELDVDLVERLPAAQPYAILNQSGYLTWAKTLEVSDVYETRPGMRAVVVVSDDIAELLRLAFPTARVLPVRLSIDGTLFHPPPRKTGRLLTYMPRRGADDLAIVFQLLRSDPLLAEWTILPLDGMTHTEVAEAMRRSSIFVTASPREGFGLPSAEAMACGNVVVGYHGFGGREFLRPEFSVPIETGDVKSLARAVGELLRNEAADPGTLASRGSQAARWVLERYSLHAETTSVIDAYSELVSPRPTDSP